MRWWQLLWYYTEATSPKAGVDSTNALHLSEIGVLLRQLIDAQSEQRQLPRLIHRDLSPAGRLAQERMALRLHTMLRRVTAKLEQGETKPGMQVQKQPLLSL